MRNPQSLAGRHILVAEDVEAVRRTIERGLSRAGARVTCKEDGRAALELLSSGVEVDLVLTDVVMPRMGGIELARELEKIRPELPIAFMTGLGITTVSRALKDAPDISNETKERVRLVARQIGYQPNRAGVRLREEGDELAARVIRWIKTAPLRRPKVRRRP